MEIVTILVALVLAWIAWKVLVGLVKFCRNYVLEVGITGRWAGHRQLVRLAHVAHVQQAMQYQPLLDETLPGKLLHRVGL